MVFPEMKYGFLHPFAILQTACNIDSIAVKQRRNFSIIQNREFNIWIAILTLLKITTKAVYSLLVVSIGCFLKKLSSYCEM
jgi:hypothetical protein